MNVDLCNAVSIGQTCSRVCQVQLCSAVSWVSGKEAVALGHGLCLTLLLVGAEVQETRLKLEKGLICVQGIKGIYE